MDNELRLQLLGVENGLRLTLNIEQYEYMPGPHDAAGIKMLLHDRDEIPRVHALGQAIPPGSHVFVGVKIVEVNWLLRKHVFMYFYKMFCETFNRCVFSDFGQGHVNS